MHQFLEALLFGVEIYARRFEPTCNQCIYVLSSFDDLTPLGLAVRGNNPAAERNSKATVSLTTSVSFRLSILASVIALIQEYAISWARLVQRLELRLLISLCSVMVNE